MRSNLNRLAQFALSSLLLAVLAISTGCHSVGHNVAGSRPGETPADALAQLQAGNRRFVEGRLNVRDVVALRRATAGGQHPFAIVLSCIDSRCPAEVIFDQGIGDIFSARVAGNVLDDDILGSLEFACQVAGAKLIAVVGHSNCGAVKGACSGVQLGHLTGLLAKIQPAVAATTAPPGTPAQFQAVAEANVRRVLALIRESSPVLDGLIRRGEVGLVGGMYDLGGGEVQFFE